MDRLYKNTDTFYLYCYYGKKGCLLRRHICMCNILPLRAQHSDIIYTFHKIFFWFQIVCTAKALFFFLSFSYKILCFELKKKHSCPARLLVLRTGVYILMKCWILVVCLRLEALRWLMLCLPSGCWEVSWSYSGPCLAWQRHQRNTKEFKSKDVVEK